MDYYPEREQVAARNILRRAEISRLTATLKSRLALATFKTQRGLQNVGLESIENLEHTAPPAKRELGSHRQDEGLQQGFTPSDWAEGRGGYASSGSEFQNSGYQNGYSDLGGRKRARTLDSATVAAAAATAGAVGARAPPTSMPAPRMQSSQSYPAALRDTLRAPISDGYLQPPVLLSSSPEQTSTQPDNEPQTPPTVRRQPEQVGTPTRNDQDGVNLLLYLATSPGRGPLSPRTPGRDINFHEYVNLFTPSPQVNRQHHLASSGIDAARRTLTFE